MLAKAFHIVLAFMMLLSSTGLLVSKHYCQGELKSMALFFEATPCHENKQMKSCPMHAMMPVSDNSNKKGCCDTQTALVKTTINQAVVCANQALELCLLAVPPPLVERLLSINCSDETPPFFTYKPPLLVYDLPVSLQTFLC